MFFRSDLLFWCHGKMIRFLLIDLKMVQSLTVHSSKTSSRHNSYIRWLKYTRTSFQKAYFARLNRKRDYYRPFCKKYENCQKNPFVYKVLNQNSDWYKSCLCMLATFCMSQNVNLELWKRMGFFFWHSTIFGTKVENASKILQRTEYKVLRHLITLPHYPDDM